MKWTSSKPTQPGWYFYKDKDGFVDMMGIERHEMLDGREWCQVAKTTVSNRGTFGMRVNDFDGHWAGPLAPPEE